MDRLTVADAAALAGVKPGTWRAYVARGQAPKPDGRFGREPWWRRRTVEDWQAGRKERAASPDIQAEYDRLEAERTRLIVEGVPHELLVEPLRPLPAE